MTAAIYELDALYPSSVCILPNDASQQHWVTNLGFNNQPQYLLDRKHKALTNAAGELFAVVHQYDRRPDVQSLLVTR